MKANQIIQSVHRPSIGPNALAGILWNLLGKLTQKVGCFIGDIFGYDDFHDDVLMAVLA